MKKNKLFIALFLPLLILIPFGNYANAQVPGYVGVAAGEQYEWKAEVHFGNVDDLLTNARDVLIDWKANLPSLDLFGLESLTIEEIYEQIAEAFLSRYSIRLSSLKVSNFLLTFCIPDDSKGLPSSLIKSLVFIYFLLSSSTIRISSSIRP